MRVQGLERDSLRLREIEKIFLPANIDPNIILQAFKAQQARKIMASSRARQFLPEKKNHEPKLNLLHVSGKQLGQSWQDMSLTKKNKRQVYSVRQALQRPLSQIIQKLSQDEQRALFQKQLIELRRYNQDRQTKSIFQNASSLKQLEVVRPTRYSLMVRNNKEEIFCEQIVMKNPILMRKVLMADKEVRRKQHAQESKRLKQSPLRHLPQLAKHQLDQDSSYILFRQFQISLNISNRLIVSLIPEGQYKAFIEPGNNGMLIKSILQSRPWWALRSNSQIQNCNLVWTQWKNTKLINILPIGQNQAAKPINGSSTCIFSMNTTRKSISFVQERRNQVKKLIGQKSQVWKHFQSNGTSYFSFGKKLQQGKFKQFLRRNINQFEYQHITNPKDQKILNHVPGGLQLHSKKHLLNNLRRYVGKKGEDLINYVPVSYHIKTSNDEEWQAFQKHFLQLKQAKGQNVWICKPGENSNRGNGIVLSNSLQEIASFVNQRCQGGRTVVIQKYIEEPLLFKGRKCDLRCFLLITTAGSRVKGYWFEQGYVRTSSRPYNLNHINNKMVHLTNDAVQKKGIEYGRYEQCNKVSFLDFQKYLQQNYPQGPAFPRILQHLKFIAAELVRSVGPKINPKGKNHTFQLFGLDYMLENNLKPYLIEANSNPCLQVAGTVLGRLIPNLIENVLRIAVDPIFPAPESESQRGRTTLSNPFETNKMELIFDSVEEGFWEASKVEDGVEQGQTKEEND